MLIFSWKLSQSVIRDYTASIVEFAVLLNSACFYKKNLKLFIKSTTFDFKSFRVLSDGYPDDTKLPVLVVNDRTKIVGVTEISRHVATLLGTSLSSDCCWWRLWATLGGGGARTRCSERSCARSTLWLTDVGLADALFGYDWLALSLAPRMLPILVTWAFFTKFHIGREFA